MPVRKLKPTSPGVRQMTISTFEEITKTKPEKSLTRFSPLVFWAATVGQVGNAEHENINIGKAGRNRWLGKRPTVRGVVMNPVDHPHGGGEGKSPIGRKHPVTPWGKPALGKKTRKKHKSSDRLIVRRRK